jgi:hypothetical protein
MPKIPTAHPKGPAIDVFNFSGGRCRTCRQQPPGGPPSTSSTSVVDVVGHAASTPQGARHQRLQLRWWTLPDLPLAPPRGPAIDVFNFDGGRCRTNRQHPQGVHHRRLQLRWWTLPDLPPAPLGGPPSTSSTSVVAAAGPATSTPQGAHHRHLQLWCWTLSDLPPTPPGAHHRRLQLRWWPLLDLPPAPPRGPIIDVFNFGGDRCWTSSSGTSREPAVDCGVKSSR